MVDKNISVEKVNTNQGICSTCGACSGCEKDNLPHWHFEKLEINKNTTTKTPPNSPEDREKILKILETYHSNYENIHTTADILIAFLQKSRQHAITSVLDKIMK